AAVWRHQARWVRQRARLRSAGLLHRTEVGGRRVVKEPRAAQSHLSASARAAPVHSLGYGLMRMLAKATVPVWTCRPMKPESGSSLFFRPRNFSLGSDGSAVNFV